MARMDDERDGCVRQWSHGGILTIYGKGAVKDGKEDILRPFI